MKQPATNQLPESGFLRIWQIIGDPAKNIPALIPIGRTAFLIGVKRGKYQKPVKHGRCIFWRVEDIRKLIDSVGAGNGDTT